MSQQTFWEWAGDEEPDESTRPRGSLDLSDVPAESAGDVDVRRAAVGLQNELESRLGTVDLVVTDNRRRMLTVKRRRGRTALRLHHMFLQCDRDVIAAISRLASGEEGARASLRDYVRRNRDAIDFRPDEDELQPEGEFFDLDELLTSAKSLLDDTSVDDVAITWGRHGRGEKSIRFGSYDFDQRLIRIHPALDREWVPSYFVEFIVYHELLHAVCPPQRSAETGRSVHTEEFQRLEREFPRYDDARAWEEENLERLLRANDARSAGETR